MAKDNPGRPIELCTAVVDGIWDKKQELINSRIPERFSGASMEDLDLDLKNEILEATQEILDDQTKNDKVGIVFYGPAGSGKTHAAYSLIKMLSEKNPESIAFTTTYSQAFMDLKNEFAHDGYQEMGSMWDKLNNESGMYDGILLVDDVSSQKLTDFEVDKMMMFLEKRLNSFMPFILTTNVKPQDFKAVFGERIASRILGYCNLVEFIEKDMRVK